MSEFWNKAETAARSAALLLAAGDRDGAVYRAYYAMNCAARAALEEIDPEAVAPKKHNSVIARFGLHVIRGRGMDPTLGRMINVALQQRLIADYERQSVQDQLAEAVVTNASTFIFALQPLISIAP